MGACKGDVFRKSRTVFSQKRGFGKRERLFLHPKTVFSDGENGVFVL
jgi:hypothetical protein